MNKERQPSKERPDYWKKAQEVQRFTSYDPTRFVAGMQRLGFEFTANGWIARRKMNRITRDGR